MAYVMARIYSGPGASKMDEISALTMKELAPKISQEPGLIRYSTIAYSDGRYGSFSAFNSPDAAAFMIALGEQERIVRLVITDAGFSGDVARMAADSFEVGAKLEWRRISTSLHAGAHGNA